MGTFSAIWKITFRKFFIINTPFPPLLGKHYVGCLQPFSEATNFFTHAMFQLVVVLKTAS
jgi:hypothetical protein